MDTEATADDHLPRPIGAVLAAARRSRGFELTDIARETRVPLRHLAAIEADDHETLPALPYAIGFVKAFARAVGVDPELAGTRFRGETSKVAHVPAAPAMIPVDERRLPPRGLVMASLAALLLVLGGIIAWSAGALDTVPPPTQVATAASAPAAGSPAAAARGTSVAVAAPTAVPTPSSGPAVAAAGTAVAVPPATLLASTSPSVSGVVITANEDAWFKVSVYDPVAAKVVTVKTGVLAKGERYVPPPTPGLRLWTGRAGALQITVDGRALPPLGGPVETVKNVSLNAADLRTRLAPAAPAGVPAAR